MPIVIKLGAAFARGPRRAAKLPKDRVRHEPGSATTTTVARLRRKRQIGYLEELPTSHFRYLAPPRCTPRLPEVHGRSHASWPWMVNRCTTRAPLPITFSSYARKEGCRAGQWAVPGRGRGRSCSRELRARPPPPARAGPARPQARAFASAPASARRAAKRRWPGLLAPRHPRHASDTRASRGRRDLGRAAPCAWSEPRSGGRPASAARGALGCESQGAWGRRHLSPLALPPACTLPTTACPPLSTVTRSTRTVCVPLER